MPTYGRWDVAVERGEGCYLYATDGRKFLDFTSGIAVTSLGHCHPHLIDAVTAQAQKLWHTSNLFQIPGQQRLAERLIANSFADTVFFNNSGAEAVELSLKVARKYQSETGHPERYRVIGCHGSFHGRSFATLAAAGAEGYLKGFGPVMDGFDHVAFNNLNEMPPRSPTRRRRSWLSRCRAKAACAPRRPIISGDCARSATNTGCSWSMTRCSAAWAAPASCSPINGPASLQT
jgi:acetylornithine/succinyldiaminopimelate/putrescine aminotransferase